MFDSKKGHLEKDKFYCTKECHEKAMNQMQWFLKRVRVALPLWTDPPEH
jgi:hypothetical protein